MLIRKCYESHSSGTELLSERTFEYAKDCANLGRLTKATYTHHPNDGSGKCYVTMRTFECEDDPTLAGALRYTTTVLTHDGLKVSTSHSRSAFTGRILRRTDAQGVTTEFAYNALGYLTARTLAVGTGYENTMSSALTVTDGVDDALQTIATDINTNKICTGFDRLGRGVYTAINSVDDAVSDVNYKLASKAFDPSGRLASSTRTDYLLDPEESYSLTSTYQYDDWGQPSRIDYSNGSWRSVRCDPIARTVVRTAGGKNQTGQVSTGQTVVMCDIGGQPVQVARYAAGADLSTAAPYSVRKMSYDGLKRLRSATDALGRTTTYRYDAWGRTIETTLPDGTLVKWRYRADSPAPQVVEITLSNTVQKVAETSMGKRAFDGLGRMVSADMGQMSWQYQYDAPNVDSQLMDRRATTVIAPDGCVRRYTYIPELHSALETVKTYPNAGDPNEPATISQTYAYDHKTGALTSASQTADQTEGTSTVYTPHPSGRPKSQTATLGGTPRTMTQDRYTLSGGRYQYTHVDGAVRLTKRDPFGRICEVGDDKMKVTLNYDPAGRLTGWQSVDLAGGHTLRIALTLDDYGREIGRTIWQDNDALEHPSWTITQVWNEVNVLSSRTINHAGTVYRKETYEYDERDRLTTWTSSGASPTDRYGNSLLGQTFTLDPFGNVTQVVSTFPNQQSNTARFWHDYDPTVPYMLSRYSNTHASYPAHEGHQATVHYDGAGRILDDGAGNVFNGYDQLGRLKQVTNALGTTTYGYDAHNRRYSQITSNSTTYFYYHGGTLVNLVQGANTTRILRSPVGSPSQYIAQESGGSVWLTIADAQGSVLGASDGANGESYAYSAYGEDKRQTSVTQQGYTGQYRDPVLPGYMLGNGYRAYLPGLMRFAQPDSPGYSPFGKGGVNPYAYCGNDPINRSDATGHFFLFNWAKKIDHGIGNFFSEHAPWFSSWFNAAGDRLYNFTTKGGILSFLPDKYNPVARLEQLASPLLQNPGFAATPIGAALQGLGWLNNTAAGFIHSTTGLSNSWSTLAVLGGESVIGDGIGDAFGDVGAMGSEVGDMGGLGDFGATDSEFPTMEYTESSGPIEPDIDNVMPTKTGSPSALSPSSLLDDPEYAAEVPPRPPQNVAPPNMYAQDPQEFAQLMGQFGPEVDHLPPWRLLAVINRGIPMFDEEGAIWPLYALNRRRILDWISSNGPAYGL